MENHYEVCLSMKGAVLANIRTSLALDCIIAPLTVMANVSFIITIFLKKSLQNPSNVLLGTLSLTDFLLGITAQPIWISHLALCLSKVNSEFLFEMGNFFLEYFVRTSFHHVILVTIDRYVAVCHPFVYTKKASCKKSITASTIVFAINIAIGIIVLKFPMSKTIVFAANVVLYLLSAVLSLKIWLVIRKLRQGMKIQRNPNGDETRRWNQDKDKAVLTFIVMAAFYICYLPLVIHMALLQLGILETVMPEKVFIGKLWTEFLVLCNSLVNPIVFYVRIKTFRDAILQTVCHRKLNGVQC